MTETIEPSAAANHANDRLPVPQPLQDESITVELPEDVIAAIQHCTQQSGQTQTETILAVLRAALGLEETQVPAEQAAIDPPPPHAVPPNLTLSNPVLRTAPPPDGSFPATLWLQEFQDLKNRLAELEHLIPKMEALEGKLLAF